MPKNWVIVSDYATLRNPDTNAVIEMPNDSNKMEKRLPVLMRLGYKQEMVESGSATGSNGMRIAIVGFVFTKGDHTEHFYPVLLMSPETAFGTTEDDYRRIVAQA